MYDAGPSKLANRWCIAQTNKYSNIHIRKKTPEPDILQYDGI